MTNAGEFLEEAMAGVEGVRREELFEQYGAAGGTDPQELEREIKARFGKPVREADGWYVYWPKWARMDARGATERLIGYPEWGEFFVMLCETGMHRLRAQAHQFHDELKERGARVVHSDVEDALMELAGELLPDTDAGSLDPREVLFRDAAKWVAAREDTPETWAAFSEGLNEAWYGTLPEFRAALRERMRLVLERAA